MLLEKGADVCDRRKKHQSTQLHYGCEYGHLEVARWLVKKAADIHTRNKGELTPFLEAYGGSFHLELVKWLAKEYGADFHVKDSNGSTPWHETVLLQHHCFGHVVGALSFMPKVALVSHHCIVHVSSAIDWR